MSGLLNNLKQQLLADKRKLGVIVLLLFFGLLLWGRLLLKDVPRTATADPKPKVAAAPSDKSRPAAGKTSRVEIVRIHSDRQLKRDLFLFDPNRYRRTIGTGETENLLKLGNSDREPTDDLLGLTEMLNMARRLDLRSVVTGRMPRAVIDDRLLAPGDWIEGFELLEIVDRYVLLERNGVVIRLWM
ncbi:MAG: hypothetical protein IT445_17645 [Phycisphaeraceae bacterium]|nr:hypothetical protein [Phycisphaeraceae bacterium]